MPFGPSPGPRVRFARVTLNWADSIQLVDEVPWETAIQPDDPVHVSEPFPGACPLSSVVKLWVAAQPIAEPFVAVQ